MTVVEHHDRACLKIVGQIGKVGFQEHGETFDSRCVLRRMRTTDGTWEREAVSQRLEGTARGGSSGEAYRRRESLSFFAAFFGARRTWTFFGGR